MDQTQQFCEDSNHIRRFLKFHKMHKCLSPTVPLQSSVESKAYSLTIHKISGLKRPQNPALSMQVALVANLFALQNNDRCFFGRSYYSPRITLEFGPDGISYEHTPIQIYFHSRIIPNKDYPLLIILEVQAYESQQDLVLKRQHLGWIEIPAMQPTPQSVKLTLRKGSPRVLLLSQQIPFESSGITFMADLLLSQEFQICQQLIPENALCGLGDEVPGLKSIFIGGQFELSRCLTVFMSGIQVLVPDTLDADIYRQVQKYRTYKYKTSEDYKGDIQIINKRLIVAYHNGWTFINSRQANNFVPLGETRMVVTENVDSKSVVFRQLVYHGVIDVNNVCYSEPTNNSGMLIAQLEYETTFLVSSLNRETIQLCLGWIPIYINNKFGSDEFIDEEFIIGPGKTLMGRPMVHFSQSDLCIKIKANLNLSGAALQPQELLQKQQSQYFAQASQAQQLQQPYGSMPAVPVGAQQLQPRAAHDLERLTSRMSEGDLRTQVKLKEVEQNLYRLQEENERLRKLAQQSQFDPAKQLEYVKAIEKLREENRMLQFTQAKQFEGLERLIKEQKPTDHKALPNLIETNPNATTVRQIDSYAYPVASAQFRPATFYSGKPLLDLAEDADNESRMLRMEEEDERKDQVFVVQVTSLKQIKGDYPISKWVYLTMNFYDLPTFKTPNLELEYQDDERNFLFQIEHGNPIRLLHNKEPFNAKFTIETSQRRYQNLFIDFSRYLFHKHMIIEIWDAESMLLYGSVRIPLRGLLRQGKQSSHIMSEVDVYDPLTQKKKGQIQILLRNIGKRGESNLTNQNMAKTEPVLGKSNGLNKIKLKSEKPVNRDIVPASHSDGQDQDRIKDRINRIKKSNLAQLPKTASKEAQVRSLHEVQKFKEMKKTNLLKSIVQGFLSQEMVLHSFYGKTEVVPFYFKNTYPNSQQFNVVIEDPDLRYLDYAEFFIIMNPAEWQHWTRFRQYPEPSTFDLVKMKEVQGKPQFYFVLESAEEVTLLFKCISFRQVDPATYSEQFVGRDPDHIKKYIASRNVSVFIQSIDGKMLDGMRVIVEPHQIFVDQILRYYERENRQSRLNLPPLYSQPQEQRPRLHITDKSVLVEWAQDNVNARLSLRVGDICTIRTFYILVYGDAFSHSILGTWKIEVYSLSSIDIEVPLGQGVLTKMTLPCDITRIVRMQSQNPKILSFPKPFDKEFTLLPGKVNLIPLSVRALREGKQHYVVTCVDVHAQEMVYSWLVCLHATAQPPSMTFELKCMEGTESRHQISYKSNINYVVTYNLVSSSERIVVLDPQLQVGPRETVNFKVRVLHGAEEEVKIFLNDTEERIFDTILLRLKYVY